ncbi:MAG TPA: MFS transporter [Kofleriaceae bacterium]|jgi:MFS family permease
MATEPTSKQIGAEERKVIFASSLGTVFEWYDFYLYATLTPFFAATFFPPGNDTAQLLSALATYAAGFLVRPFGALVFGRVGDLVGRKYTFLVTITVMGISTFAVGLLPSYASVGVLAPILLTLLRMLQGLALGGEYGGAAIYVAEHSRPDRRGYSTSWIQTTATLGFFLSLAVILICRQTFSEAAFKDWGWRIPFWVSLVLLVFSIYIRLKLYESPVFLRMKEEGRVSKQPLTESFLRYPNNKYVLLALFGAVAGQGVVWYTGQFYALFFLTGTLKLDYTTAYILIGIALLIGTPLFLVFGKLSDRIGRRKIILAGCLIAAVTYFPVFKMLTHYTNPALEEFSEKTPIVVSADDCVFHLLTFPGTEFTQCDRVKNFLTSAGLSFKSEPPVAGKAVVTKIGETTIEGWQLAGGKEAPKRGASATDPRFLHALADKGYPGATKKVVDGKETVTLGGADRGQINYVMVLLILVFLIVLVTMVYGPIAALLVELFPAKIRYTSMSLPYHLANGWIGGMLPFVATAMAAASGNIYRGLWYPVVVAVLTVVIGGLFLHDPKPDFDIHA